MSRFKTAMTTRHYYRSRPAGKSAGIIELFLFPRDGRALAFNPVVVGIVGTGVSIGLLGLWLVNVPVVFRNAGVIVIAVALSLAGVAASWLFSFVLHEHPEEKKLRQLLSTDSLTHLLNRHSFETQLCREWDRARRHGMPLALLAIDVDHFGQFNTTYGRARGDQALVSIANCIEEAGRRYDCAIARFGGDQFAVLMTGASAGKATELASEIRVMVERVRIRHCASAFRHVTVSVGSATCAQLRTIAPASLLSAASLEMQEAKMSGRNQICSTTLGKSIAS